MLLIDGCEERIPSELCLSKRILLDPHEYVEIVCGKA